MHTLKHVIPEKCGLNNTYYTALYNENNKQKLMATHGNYYVCSVPLFSCACMLHASCLILNRYIAPMANDGTDFDSSPVVKLSLGVLS